MRFIVAGCLFLLNVAIVHNALAQFRPPFPPPPGAFPRVNGPDGMRGRFVSRLDRDGDNRVSREEFDGPPDQFDVLDRNHDGFLTEDERPGLMAPGRRPTFPAPAGTAVTVPSPAVQQRPRAGEFRQSPTADETETRPSAGGMEQSLPDNTRDQNSTTDASENNPAGNDKQQRQLTDKGVEVPTADAVERIPTAKAETTGEATTSHWPWGFILSAMAALILALIWGLNSSRKFRRVKDAVEALNPHLLGVTIDNNIIITEATDALCRATGYRNRDLVGKPLVALGSHPTDKSNTMQGMWDRIRRGMTWKGEVKLIRKNGSALWADAVISPLRRKNEKTTGYTVFYQDITQRKHFENLSMRDELTGLFNRRYFNEVSPSLWIKARREQQLFGLCILDVDNFKPYNDTYGHPAGDNVLAAIGGALTHVFQRRGDIVFRLGGEEFGAIFMVNNHEEAFALADRTLQEIRNLKIDHSKNPPGIVTASMGLKLVDADNTDKMKTLYKKADQALYEAKQSGRNRFIVASS